MVDLNQAFELRVKPYIGLPSVLIRVFDDLGWDDAGRIKLTCEVRYRGRIVFPRGKLVCALHGTSDGIKARRLVLDMVAMQPGDTDADYFADYTQSQLDFAHTFGEALALESELRYGDKE